MRNVVRFFLVICCAVAALNAYPANAEKRVALVIGNGSYGHHAGLPNVPNDAAAMAALFKAAKFNNVEIKSNLGVAELRRVLREFSGNAAAADVAVLFFAGHGIEVDRTNYLIPVDARLATDLDVEDETVSLDRVLQLLEPAKRLRLVILDACRENPFAGSMKRTSATRSVGRGLGRVEPTTSNTLVAYAAKAGAVAADGRGANSPFTSALVKHLLTPGLDLRLAFGHVRDEVLASTGNKQEPYLYGSAGGGTVSIVSGLPIPALSPAQPSDAERAWAAAKDTTSIAVLEAFRRQYGASNAFYDRLAEARIEELKKQQVAVVVPPVPKPESSKVVEPAVGVFNPSRAAKPLTPAEERALKPGDAFRECDECPEIVVVPAGSFMMGSSPAEIAALEKETKSTFFKTEGPQRTVIIAQPFAVGKYEVTFAEWDACVAAGGCKHSPWDGDTANFKPYGKGWGRGTRPVRNVSWYDITNEFLPWLSRKTGKTYRLLSEAEWEYAARGVTSASLPSKRYWWGDQASHEYANYGVDDKCCSHHKQGRDQWLLTAPVGQFPANPFGLHDMHGNEHEWVQDCWHWDYTGAPTDGAAWLSSCYAISGVVRGGGFGNVAWDIRSASRSYQNLDDKKIGTTFRVARTL